MANNNEHTTNKNTEQLMTVGQVSTMLNISRTTLHELTKTGKIHFLKIGKCVRYKPSDIDNFLKISSQAKTAN